MKMQNVLLAAGWLFVSIATAFDAYVLIKLLTLYADVVEAWLLETSRANKDAFTITVGALAFGESMPFVSLIFPFWGILAGIGVILPKTALNFTTVMTAVAVGAAAGDWIAYSLGYHAEGWAERNGLLKPEKGGWLASLVNRLMPWMHWLFDRWWGGPIVITVARFSGPFRATVPVIAGAIRMNWYLFQFANLTSAFLWAFVLLKFGEKFLDVIMGLLRYAL